MDIVNYQILLYNSIVPQPVAQFTRGHNVLLIDRLRDQETAILPQAVAKLPWRHNCVKAEINLPDRSRPMATILRWNQQMGNCN